MAEGCTGGSWWGGWLQTAKEKSASALDFVKKDLVEFTSVMQEDTKKVTTEVVTDVKTKLTHENTAAATQKVKAGVSSFLGGLSKALIIEAEDLHEDPHVIIGGQPVFDRAKARLHAIQLDIGTYCNVPNAEDYNKWNKEFNLDEKKGEISEMLVTNSHVRSLYTQLVPSSVAHIDFWKRYFYRVYQLEQDEERKKALMKRADVMQTELDWDEEEEWGDITGAASPPKDGAGYMEAAAPREQQAKLTTPLPDVIQSEKTKTIIDQESEITAPVPVETPSSANHSKPTKTATENKITQYYQTVPTDCDSDPENKSLVESTNVAKYETQEVVKDEAILPKNIETVPEILSNTAVSDKAETQVSQLDEPAEVSGDIEHAIRPSDMSSSDQSQIEKPLEKEDQPSQEVADIKTKDRGDLVMVGSDRTTPSSDGNKESTSLDDDWEQDFDVDSELTEQDLKIAEEVSKKLAAEGIKDVEEDEDWENWE